MTKNKIKNKLKELNNQYKQLLEERNNDPKLVKIKQEYKNIENEIFAKYKEKMDSLHSEMNELKNSLYNEYKNFPPKVIEYFKNISNGVQYNKYWKDWKLVYYKDNVLIFTIPSGTFWANMMDTQRYSPCQHYCVMLHDTENHYLGLTLLHRTIKHKQEGGKLSKKTVEKWLKEI